MALPKKKMSRSRRDRRRAHQALEKLNLVSCPQCHEPKLSHIVCPSCGTFRGVAYLNVEDAKSSK